MAKKELLYVNLYDNVKRNVQFIDADKTKVSVDTEIKLEGIEGKLNWETLEPVKDGRRFSMCGSRGGCLGQIYDSIVPRTETQKQLVDLWKKYHLNGMRAGTKVQEEWLKSEKGEGLRLALQTLLTGIGWRDLIEARIVSTNAIDTDPDLTQKFFHYKRLCDEGKDLSASWELVATQFLATRRGMMLWAQLRFEKLSELRKVLEPYGVYAEFVDLGELYNLWTGELLKDVNNYRLDEVVLKLKGINPDREYKYGHGWLMQELPDDLEKVVETLCLKIEEEEAERRTVLEKDLQESFGDDDVHDFEFSDETISDEDMIDRVSEVRDWDDDMVLRFIALGKSLGESFVSLLDSFEEEYADEQKYSYGGTDYYIGTAAELEDVCRDLIDNDSEYKYFWQQAVESGSTELGLDAWKESVVVDDGFAHILDRWDGEGKMVKIKEEEYWICNCG